MKTVNFYLRPDCQLCEEGLLTLKLVQEDCAFELTVINIEENEALHEKYMLMIPVVTCDEQILQYGQLDYVTLFEALHE
ncbi:MULTISPECIES: glutaredoxin family protein [Metasolibacillus]|uniref:glutaredoxin family protein n=1 Tax=Metasolibacillus TaxID=2703677 RepID=UPI000D3D00D5|nr:glutaredoxin family protein [Metasolibacillus fluoroglycofenilyticus]